MVRALFIKGHYSQVIVNTKKDGRTGLKLKHGKTKTTRMKKENLPTHDSEVQMYARATIG